MKRLFLIILTFFSFAILKSQNVNAEYDVIKDISYTKPNGQKVKVGSIAFKSFLHKTGNKYYSYDKALFLDKYPEGTMEYSENSEDGVTIAFPKDSLQVLSFKDLDLMQYVFLGSLGDNENGSKLANRGKYNPDYFKWIILPDTTTIFGLKCQKAYLNRPGNGERLFDIWFCADVPLSAGPSTLVLCPGLIVEAYNAISGGKYSLTSYSIDTPMPESFKKIKFFGDVIK